MSGLRQRVDGDDRRRNHGRRLRGRVRGLWFDRYELMRVDESHESACKEPLNIECDPNLSVDRTKRLRCPRGDDAVMARHFFNAKRRVTVDDCPAVWLLFVPTVIFGVAQSLNLPNVFSLLNKAAPDENRGAFLALNSTILRLGQTLGPVLMAVIAAPLGLAGAYLAAGTLAVAMFVVALALIR
jgi:MFS transporter